MNAIANRLVFKAFGASLLGAAVIVSIACASSPTRSGDHTSTPTSDGGSRCVASSSPSTTSFDLAAWPALTPTTAMDLTAQANVGNVAVPGAPAGVLVTKDGQWVFTTAAATPGSLVALRRNGTALTVDHSIAMPANETPFGLALSPDGSMIAVSLSDEVALVDVAKAESNAADAVVATVTTKSVMRTSIDVAFSADGHFVFAALEYDAQVAVVDAQAHAYVGAIPIAGNAVTGVVVSPDGKSLFVTCEVASEFAAANPSPAQDQDIGAITVVDVGAATTSPATSVKGRAFVGRAPVRSIISADGTTLWTSVRGSNAIIELDVANLLSTTCDPRVATVNVGPAPVGLAFTSATRIAVANSNRFAAPNAPQTVMLVDAVGATVVGQIGVGAFPREMDGDSAALFVSNYDSKSISGIDLTKLP